MESSGRDLRVGRRLFCLAAEILVVGVLDFLDSIRQDLMMGPTFI